MRRSLTFLAAVLVAIAALSSIVALWHAKHPEDGMTRWRWAYGLVGMTTALSGPAAGQSLPVPPTVIGINISKPSYFRRSRSFANLAIGSVWGSRLPDHRVLGPDDVDRDGNLKRLPGGAPVERMLTLPNDTVPSATIRCSFEGKGTLRPTMAVGNIHTGLGSVTFDWANKGYQKSNVILQVTELDPADPLRNLDCRETTMPRSARFDPYFVDFLKGFRVLRFMDWQNTNNNRPVTWATRHTPRSIDVVDADGAAIEDMIALSKEVGADPWFNMPWNGDDDYVLHFAKLVHDTLPRDRKVYVELSNEVWNAHFGASKQALEEGTAEGLSANPEEARLFRYAEKMAHVMDIWAKVFADRPGQLVRVAGCQNGGYRSGLVLGFRDTARHIDALATAPYFAFGGMRAPSVSPDEVFPALDAAMKASLGRALEAKALAAKYGKRYIAYEAGQHVVIPDLASAQQIQRDPRMYDAYKQYLEFWRARIGDTIMLYESSQPIVPFGAFGLVEYLGQPVEDAPKMRAVREFLQAGKGKAAH